MRAFLESALIEALSREESVRGELVRRVRQQAELADSEELALLERALQLLLERFRSMEGNVP